jgi:LysR family nitrogen assimilation transcriptional regulator
MLPLAMDLRQLKFFVRAAEQGSLTRAAADLAVAQPVLSRQIRDLESELGVQLLSRNGRGVALTEAGKRFLLRAQSISQDVQAAREEASSQRTSPSGTVSVAMIPSAGAILWVPLLARVQKSFPDIRLQVAEGYSGHIVEWLAGGKTDVGLVYQPQRAPNLHRELLLDERLYLVGAPDQPAFRSGRIDFPHLAKLPLILPAAPHSVRRLMQTIAAKRRVTLNIELEVNAYPAIKSIVIARRGFTVLPAAPVLPEVHAGQLAIAEIHNPVLTQQVALVTSSHHGASSAARAVCRIIKQLVEEMIASERWPARYRFNRP